MWAGGKGDVTAFILSFLCWGWSPACFVALKTLSMWSLVTAAAGISYSQALSEVKARRTLDAPESQLCFFVFVLFSELQSRLRRML